MDIEDVSVNSGKRYGGDVRKGMSGKLSLIIGVDVIKAVLIAQESLLKLGRMI